MADRIHLQVVTPQETVCDSGCASVRLPLADGSAGILPGHAPLLGAVEEGIVRYTSEGATYYVAVGRGVVHVSDNEVLLLVDSAMRAQSEQSAPEAPEQVISKERADG